METHAAFLRLFVRCGLNAMAKGGSGKGNRCLFLLDEFHTLGRIDEIEKAAGLMRSYGVHLWPFLQNLGQLQDLYGPNAAQAFFANADAHVFLGVSDTQTLQYISNRVGNYDLGDAARFMQENAPPVPNKSDYRWSPEAYINALDNASKEGQTVSKVAYSTVGAPRFAPNAIAAMIGKSPGSITAAKMIVFLPGGKFATFQPLPYWVTASPAAPKTVSAPSVSPNVADTDKPDMGGFITTRNKSLIVLVAATIIAPVLLSFGNTLYAVIASVFAVWHGISYFRLRKPE